MFIKFPFKNQKSISAEMLCELLLLVVLKKLY